MSNTPRGGQANLGNASFLYGNSSLRQSRQAMHLTEDINAELRYFLPCYIVFLPFCFQDKMRLYHTKIHATYSLSPKVIMLHEHRTA